MRDTRNPYSSRDWADTIGWFGFMLLLALVTLGAVLVLLGSAYLMVVESQPGYILLALGALGFGCMFGAGTKWAYDSMMES